MKKLIFLFILSAYTTNAEYITVFAHGIIDNSSQSKRFQKTIVTPQVIAPNFADSIQPKELNFNTILHTICSYFGKNVNRNAMFMGQKDDIAVLDNTIKKLPTTNNLILYGCSRGAATLVSYLGIYNPTNISALILDACPANISDTIQMTLAQLGINPNTSATIFSYLFPQYDPTTALPPIYAIKNIENKKLPILLVHSMKDINVHYTHSLKLYKAFLEAEFTNVHLCILPHGKHSFLLQDETIQKTYTHAVHTFYQKYNLPHDKALVSNDKSIPGVNLDEINIQIQSYDEQITKTYLNNSQKNMYYSCAAIALAIMYWYVKNNDILQ